RRGVLPYERSFREACFSTEHLHPRGQD
ncbi:hypothetical protein WHR41_09331, partial [Cladosporium halotolerans]